LVGSSLDSVKKNCCSAEEAQRILSPVPYDKGFHFFMPKGYYTGETAVSLCHFLRDLEHEDMESIQFHLERGDFQKWIRDTLGDDELAQRIDKVSLKLSEEKLRKQLVDVVQKRISELQLIE
jgi:hypothetical protein